MLAEPVRRYLDENGIRYRVRLHEPRFTAQETAQQAHVSGKIFAKAVVLRAPGGDGVAAYLVAALPANERVDLARLGRLLGHPVELASEDEISLLFPGIEIGALPPFGALARLPVVADAALSRVPSIVFHGGRLTALVEMRWMDFQRLVLPRVLEYGRVIGAPSLEARAP
jgi:Ala-tRNA(Pro) deacylase